MASDDPTNPYETPSHWPRLRQGPMRLGPLPKAIPRAVTPEPEPEPPAAAPAPLPAPLPWQELRGPASIFTGAATPLPSRLAPAEPLVRQPPPEPPPEPPLHLDRDPPEIGLDVGDFDLGIPAPEPEALVIPITPRRTRSQGRRSSPLVPVLAAAVVGVVGVGLLAYLMTAGQRAATTPPALPPAVDVATVQPPPMADPTLAPPTQAEPSLAPAPAPAQPSLTPAPAPVTPRRLAAVRRPVGPPAAAVDAAPLPVADPTPAQTGPTETAGPRITIPMPDAPPPPPAPVVRAPPPGPDQPIATHPPD